MADFKLDEQKIPVPGKGATTLESYRFTRADGTIVGIRDMDFGESFTGPLTNSNVSTLLAAAKKEGIVLTARTIDKSKTPPIRRVWRMAPPDDA